EADELHHPAGDERVERVVVNLAGLWREFVCKVAVSEPVGANAERVVRPDANAVRPQLIASVSALVKTRRGETVAQIDIVSWDVGRREQGGNDDACDGNAPDENARAFFEPPKP